MAVRRGVALGGRGLRVPAAARRCWTARRSRSGSRRCSATSSRPCAASPATATWLPPRGAGRRARRGLGRPRRAAASTSSPPRCAAPRATTSGPPTAFEERGRDLIGAFARSGRRGAVDLGGHPRRAAAAGHRRRPRPPAGHRHRLAPSAASAAGTAGFWLPECAYSPGLERGAGAHGVQPLLRGPDRRRTASGRPSTSSRWRSTRGRWPCPIDWQTVELVWNERDGLPGPLHLPRLPPAHGPRPAAVGELGRALRPRGGARRSHAATRGDFLARVAERAEGGGLVCCALDTELLGHWWYEGQEWLADGAGSRPASTGWTSSRCQTASTAFRPSSASSCRPPGARARTCPPGTAAGVAELAFGARRAELRHPGGRRGATPGRRRRSSARRASCWPPVERLGVHDHARARRRLPAAAHSPRTARITTPPWPLWQTPRPCRSPPSATSPRTWTWHRSPAHRCAR